MNKKSILFISTNSIWGGSEILWTHSAKRLSENNYPVLCAVNYDYEQIRSFIPDQSNYFDLKKRYRFPNLFLKLLQRIHLGVFPPTDRLLGFIKDKPVLAVISQGNNVVGLSYMKFCHDHQIPFITITHLVTETSWPSVNDGIIADLYRLYTVSKANFFVSLYTRAMHEKMFGGRMLNNKLIYNPFTKPNPPEMVFPEPENGIYKIALIGRLEIFHKGYDLLFDVIRTDKWKHRPITFSIFGKGPHRKVLQRWIEEYKIDNIIIKDHIENVADIWKEHHLLMMPSRLEGQSLSLIEAMKFKRPSVVTRVGGIEELVEEGVSGFIAAFPSAEHIDEALERAWNKREEWKAMGETAFHFINERHPADAISYFNNQLETFIDK